MKTCKQCSYQGPEEDFLYGGRYLPRCNKCTRENFSLYYQQNWEVITQRTKKRYVENKESIREKAKLSYKKMKTLVFEHYCGGTPKCACCGEEHIEFLSIDHINGEGKKIGPRGGVTLYAWIIKNNYPPYFRVLCFNCNLSLGFFGYCPHNNL